MRPVIYVVVNKGLQMTPGKIAAQVGHAVAMCLTQTDAPYSEWLQHDHRWIIVLEAESGEQINNLHQYLWERGMTDAYRVIDEGINEIPPFSVTALGVGPYDKDSAAAQNLSDLKKFRYTAPTHSHEYAEVWNAAVTYMRDKPWYKRLFNKT